MNYCAKKSNLRLNPIPFANKRVTLDTNPLRHPALVLTPSQNSAMHIAATIAHGSTAKAAPIYSFHVPVNLLNLHAPASIKTHQKQQKLAFPSTHNLPSSPSTSISLVPPRKLLCKTPHGKYVREDYLVKKLSAKEVQELVRGERTVPLIIDFYATWCGPCILMAQELEMLAVEYESNAMIVKVDTDDEYEFSRDMQVRGLPTLYFISPNPSKDAIRTEGLIPIQMMRNILDNDM